MWIKEWIKGNNIRGRETNKIIQGNQDTDRRGQKNQLKEKISFWQNRTYKNLTDVKENRQ